MTGWYELPDIFGIKAWERLISPHINQAGKMVHEAGALHCYMHTEGNPALAGQLLACEIDVIWGFDPYMGGDETQPSVRCLFRFVGTANHRPCRQHLIHVSLFSIFDTLGALIRCELANPDPSRGRA